MLRLILLIMLSFNAFGCDRGLDPVPFVPGPHDIEFYGGAGDRGITDNTPALNAAVAAGEDHLCFGKGHYWFKTKPAPIGYAQGQGVLLEGVTVAHTSLVKAYNAVDKYDVMLDFQSNGVNGGGAINMGIGAAAGYVNGTLIRVYSPLGSPASYMKFENLNFTYDTGGNYDRAVFLDCNAANTAAQGCRSIKFNNITMFQPTGKSWVFDIQNGVSTVVSNAYVFGNMRISGANTTTTTSTNVLFSGVVGGNLTVDSSVGVVATGSFDSITLGATAARVNIFGITNALIANYGASGSFTGDASSVTNGSSASFKLRN